ncbi:MAG TPA: polysaccharide biosynthesis/export family protein [Candidatus Binatia bacterium]|nr:polysaccharide biosynthesis/export family protein [Candidatus Binatia bacterium]
MNKKVSEKARSWDNHRFYVFALCASVLLLVLFRNSLDPRQLCFSNDGPLGGESAAFAAMPGAFFGVWQDLNSIGADFGSRSPCLTSILRLLLGPLGFAKFYVPLLLLFLGCSAWFFFRQMRFSPLACILGGLAAMLNSNFFSPACWGVGPQPICFGFTFLALAALASEVPRWPWLKYVLAGLAVGMAVTEAADVGAIFSVLFAAFVFYSAFVREEQHLRGAARGVASVAVVAVFAAFIAAHALTGFIGINIKGIAGTQQDAQTKADQWDFATQWSLPKNEALSLLVPGLFGFRMDTPDGGSYWGAVGRAPSFDRYFSGGPLKPGDMVRIDAPADPRLDTVKQVGTDGKLALPSVGDVKAAGLTTSEIAGQIGKQLSSQGSATEVKVLLEPPPGSQPALRQTGGGIYAGVLVVLVAAWAATQSLRRQSSVFNLSQRKLLWFWLGIIVVSLLLAFGRFAPFYQFLYALPYFSTIRNPAKFTYLVNFALVILFAYGIDGLWRTYLQPAGGTVNQRSGWPAWWSKADRFDKRWVLGCGAFLALSLVTWAIYSHSRPALEQYLGRAQVSDAPAAIAAFSIRQVGLFVLLSALAAGLVALILRGTFAGPRARWAGLLLGLLLVVDLGQANLPWIVYWDYNYKYETEARNPLIEFLRDKPYEHRVAILPRWPFERLQMPPEALSAQGQLASFYNVEWAQHHFLYNNIQSLDVVQMPREPANLRAFQSSLLFDGVPEHWFRIARLWQLTNTRYVLALTGYVDVLDQLLDPTNHSFRVATRFELTPKPGVSRPVSYDDYTVALNSSGRYAVLEFTNALPRAKLYSNWQVNTNDAAALAQLTSPAFAPEKSVIVSMPVPPPSAASATNVNAGTVEFTSYTPKDIVFKANAALPSVFLLNDKFGDNWRVFVDGKQETLLRCNFLMRGVYLTPGTHTVEFRFQVPLGPMYISLLAIGVGLGLLALLLVAPQGPAKLQTPEPKLSENTELQAPLSKSQESAKPQGSKKPVRAG